MIETIKLSESISEKLSKMMYTGKILAPEPIELKDIKTKDDVRQWLKQQQKEKLLLSNMMLMIDEAQPQQHLWNR